MGWQDFIRTTMKKAVLAFYKFVHLQNPHGEKEKLLSFLQEISTVGTIILGKEGINGMCSLDIAKLEKVRSFLQRNFSLENSDFKTNLSPSDVFKKLSVRRRRAVGVEVRHRQLPMGVQRCVKKCGGKCGWSNLPARPQRPRGSPRIWNLKSAPRVGAANHLDCVCA